MSDGEECGLVLDVDTFAVHDGPGIRMAVYLKGCPLECAWCHSPESQRAVPELVFMADRCAFCGACARACPSGLHTFALPPASSAHLIERLGCSACGACARACAAGALQIKGVELPASEVVRRAVRLGSFFRHSGGGITLTGGEVTRQAVFALAILEGCRREGIHTAVETAGLCPWETLDPIVRAADLVLYDLKLMDAAEHRRWTGASNSSILDNAARLPIGKTVFRVPLIPRVTDTDANLDALFDFARGLGAARVQILAYNAAAGAKYEWLGRAYALQGEPQPADRLADIRRRGAERGLLVEAA